MDFKLQVKIRKEDIFQIRNSLSPFIIIFTQNLREPGNTKIHLCLEEGKNYKATRNDANIA